MKQSSFLSDYSEVVYEIVKTIPKGKVLRYKDVARLAGLSSPRHVGKILHQNPYGPDTPCHRVVNSVGRVAPAYAFGGPDVQMQRLKEEGVCFLKNNLVDLKQSLFQIE
jgi:methylated-DNA-protein-cysteine methyltransferase-like protein